MKSARSTYLDLITLALVACLSQAYPQSLSAQQDSLNWLGSSTSLLKYVQEHFNELAPPELKRRQAIRRTFQQNGYANVILDVVRQDGWSALISYIRVKLYIAYSLPRRTFWCIPPDPKRNFPGVACPDDWSFPVDPWEKK